MQAKGPLLELVKEFRHAGVFEAAAGGESRFGWLSDDVQASLTIGASAKFLIGIQGGFLIGHASECQKSKDGRDVFHTST